MVQKGRGGGYRKKVIDFLVCGCGTLGSRHRKTMFGGQTVVENTLRQEGNQLVNEGSKNMK